MQLLLVGLFLVVLASAFVLLGKYMGREVEKLELLASKGREFHKAAKAKERLCLSSPDPLGDVGSCPSPSARS